MTFTISTVQGLAVAAALPLILLLLVWVFIGRPWELSGLPWWGRLRIVNAVNGYDAWLSMFGVRGRRRRDLRAELQANLWDAAQQVGVAKALTAVGSTRALAKDAAARPAGPNWLGGLLTGLFAAEGTVVLYLVAATIWFDAAEASGAARVEGGTTFLPGAHLFWERPRSDGGFGLGVEMGPAPLLVALVVFLAFARPWRRRGSGNGANAVSAGRPAAEAGARRRPR